MLKTPDMENRIMLDKREFYINGQWVSPAVANDFVSFFAEQSDIQLVCFNGQKAAQLFARLVATDLDPLCRKLRYETLPSTSPAHAAMSFGQKLEHWSILRDRTLAG